MTPEEYVASSLNEYEAAVTNLLAQLAAVTSERDRLREIAADLMNQYMQYPEGYITHEFMSAQEEAIDYFEKIGWLVGGQYERYNWTPAALERSAPE